MEHAAIFDEPCGVVLQERDLSILLGLFESRLMTTAQVAAIYFEGRLDAAKKRLQKLKLGGFVAERPKRAYEPSILFLTKKSFEVLAEGGLLDHYPSLIWTNLEKRARVSDLTLKHELAVMDVKAAFYRAAAATDNVRVAQFTTWPLLYQFEASRTDPPRTMTVKPDGFIRLRQVHDGQTLEHTFFLEVDRSTEVLSTLITRCLCYRDFYRRGGLAVRAGRPSTEYEQFPFRVLIVVRTEERRNNLCARLLALKPPILSQVWLAVISDATTKPLTPIWIRPRDCQDPQARSLNGSGASTPRGFALLTTV